METSVFMSLFRSLWRLRMHAIFGFALLGLGACGGGIDGTKDLFGAIGYKSGVDPFVAPGDSACGAATGSGSGTGTGAGAGAGAGGASGGIPTGRCFSAAEAANAVAQQCADCKIVLTFKGTNESTFCGSIALTASKLKYGVGSGSSVIAAQDAAIASCKVSEGAVTPSTCTLAKTRCL